MCVCVKLKTNTSHLKPSTDTLAIVNIVVFLCVCVWCAGNNWADIGQRLTLDVFLLRVELVITVNLNYCVLTASEGCV